MGLLTTLAKSYLNLNETDRHTIFKLFGSFKANKFADNPTQLIQNGYESNVDVYAVIKKLTDVFLDIPYVIERRTADGWELLEDSTLHELMEKPNVGKGYTWNDIDEQLLIYLLASGNGYLVGQTGFSSRYDEVDVLPSPFVEVQTNNDFFMPSAKFQFKLNTNRRVYDQEEIEHIKFFNPSYCTVQESYCGLIIIQVAAMAVQVGNDRWSADANLLQNRGAIGLITDKSNRPMTPEEAARVQAGFQKRNAGTENFGKVTVTNKDLNFISMAMNSTDLQLVEKGVVNLRAICNVFGLDSSLFNDPANKTFNNRKEAEKAMYTNAIMPIAEKVMAKHNQYLALNHYPDGSVRLRKDFSGVEALQQDKKMEAEKDKIVLDGLNTILSMPVSNDSKKILIQDTYPEMSEEFVDSLMVEITE